MKPQGLLRLRRIVSVVVAIGAIAGAPVAAQDAKRIDLTRLGEGASAFPAFWRPYRQQRLPQVDLAHGPELARHIADGTLQLTLREFLQLVVENDLDLLGARYSTAIAQVDVLRTVSGQAARGVNVAPVSGSLFTGAIGAGVSSTAALSAGGTGGAAISSQGKLVTIGPRGVFDPTFSANLSYDHLASPLNTTKVAGSTEVIVPSTVLQTRFQQELPDGTSYAVSFNLQRQASTQTGLLFNPAMTSFMAFQVYQPLLNGFGIALNRRFVTVANNNRQVVQEAYHTTLNDVLVNAANAYWDLVAARENVDVDEQTVATAQRQADETRQREELGTATPFDVLTSDSRLASSRVALLIAQTRAQQQEALAKTLIGNTDDPALDAISLEPTDVLPEAMDADVPPLADNVKAALSKRSSIHQASLNLQNQQIAEDYTHKNLLPTLSVYAAYDAYALNAHTSLAVRQLWQAAFPEYSVGFTLSIPVFNRAAQADAMRAQFERRSAETALERAKAQIELQVKSATVILERGRPQIDAAHRTVESSRTAYEGARAKMEIGLATPYQIMLAEDDLRSAESAEIQARVNYAKALVSFDMATGNLLERNGIDFGKALRGGLFAGALTPEAAPR
jgi:outer membrane protein TolC